MAWSRKSELVGRRSAVVRLESGMCEPPPLQLRLDVSTPIGCGAHMVIKFGGCAALMTEADLVDN